MRTLDGTAKTLLGFQARFDRLADDRLNLGAILRRHGGAGEPSNRLDLDHGRVAHGWWGCAPCLEVLHDVAIEAVDGIVHRVDEGTATSASLLSKGRSEGHAGDSQE